MYMSPVVFSSNPAIIESNVDLPHPLGPIILTNSPLLTLKLTFSSANTSPSLFWYFLLIFFPLFSSYKIYPNIFYVKCKNRVTIFITLLVKKS